MKKLWGLMAIMLILGGLPGPVLALTNNAIQGAHQEMLSEMETEEPQIFSPVEVLWRNTLQRDPTLQLALQKMAEKTGQVKPQDKANWTNMMLKSLVQAGGIGGSIMAGNPGPLMGSSILNRMTVPAEENKALTTVTSADLVILAREIEEAQVQLVFNFLKYRQAVQEHDKIQADLETLENQSKTVSADISQIMQATLSEQNLKLQHVQDNLMAYRNLLVLAAGGPAMDQVDQLMKTGTLPKTETTPHDKLPTLTPEGSPYAAGASH
jgi:hypothetical protein